MNAHTAIETRYAGCRFRSRLEARWAVFFDTVGIQWEYEPQGFDLGKLGPYLPDFWLVDHEAWFEAKGKQPEYDGPEERKARALRDVTDAPVILAAGQIGDRAHHFYAYDVGDSSAGAWDSGCLWSKHGDDGLVELAVDASASRTFYADSEFQRHLPWAQPDRDDDVKPSRPVWDAYMAARSARFEHGEQPASRLARDDGQPLRRLKREGL